MTEGQHKVRCFVCCTEREVTGTPRKILITAICLSCFIITVLYYSKGAVKNFHIGTDLNRTFPALVLAYYRSGSTITADIIQISPDVFYMYEPLQEFGQGIYFTNNKYCFSSNDTCRLPTEWKNDPTQVLAQFTNIYNCDLKHLRSEVVGRIERNQRVSMDSAFLHHCSKSINISECLSKLSEVCYNRKIRLVKTIRLHFTAADYLMTKYPDLKVIHLLRDPRGILLSQQEIGVAFTSKRVNATCKRMLSDLLLNRKLQHKYAGRIKTVFYENIAMSPITYLHEIYNFLGLRVSKEIEEVVKNHTMAGRTDGGRYSPVRANSAETATKWRTKITKNQKQLIEASCEELYKEIEIYKIP